MGIDSIEYEKAFQYQAYWKLLLTFGHQREDVERYWKRLLHHLGTHILLMEQHCQR